MGGTQQKYNKLAGKHVLVIGGTSGTGFAVAEASIESSARVTISSNPTKVTTAIERIKKAYPSASISGYACDLSGRSEEIAEAYLWLMKDANVRGFVTDSDAGIKLV